MKNRFHSIENGCDLEVYKEKKRNMLYCKTHDKKVCHCGYEFGYHFNTRSKSLNEYGDKGVEK